MPEGAASLHSHSVRVGDIEIANDRPFVLIAGPCALESRDHALEMATAVKEAADRAGVRAIYKTSFDKANRTSLGSPRGIGLDKALAIFADVRAATGLPVLTDVHTGEQCAAAAEAVDVLQIPAFLCRQTDLLLAAGQTGKAVNVKKGQFLAPWDMKNVLAKVASTGNRNILQTERGVSFGYNTLVSDMRALPILAQNGYPVVFDATSLGAAAGRAGRRFRRPARIRAGAGPRRCRHRRCRALHGNPPGSGQRAQRRTEHGAGPGAAGAAADPRGDRPPGEAEPGPHRLIAAPLSLPDNSRPEPP